MLKKVTTLYGLMLLMLFFQPLQLRAEVWVFFRPDIPLHVDTVNQLKQKTKHELAFCPVGKTSFSFLESHPPEFAIALGNAAQQLALTMQWKVRILVTLVDEPASDKRLLLLNTNQPILKQILLLQEMNRNLKTIWYPYISERFVPDKILTEAAESAGIKIDACRIVKPRQLPVCLQGLARQDTAVILPPDPGIMNDAIIQSILLASFRAHTPIAAFSESLVRQGCAFAYILTPENLATALVEIIEEVNRDPHSQDFSVKFERWDLILNTTIIEKFLLTLPQTIRETAKKRF